MASSSTRFYKLFIIHCLTIVMRIYFAIIKHLDNLANCDHERKSCKQPRKRVTWFSVNFWEDILKIETSGNNLQWLSSNNHLVCHIALFEDKKFYSAKTFILWWRIGIRLPKFGYIWAWCHICANLLLKQKHAKMSMGKFQVMFRLIKFAVSTEFKYSNKISISVK